MTLEKQRCIVRLLTEARVEVAAARHEVSNCSPSQSYIKTANAPPSDQTRKPFFSQEQK